MGLPARCRGPTFTTYQRVSCHQRNKNEPHARTFRPRRIIPSPICGRLRACVRVRTKTLRTWLRAGCLQGQGEREHKPAR
jgi:hypothetical protein